MLIEEMEITKNLSVATNGAQALEIIKEFCQQGKCPELIFVDINMPVMDGFDFLQACREVEKQYHNDAIIIILTTSTNPKDIARMKEMGITEFMIKPLTEESLEEIVKKYFN